ncbi:MAG: D-alanyl-D-alanine carboxypeptidase [Bifidobacterium tibiigranuli]|nr:D-alanyl-D-alanine carboxypeptidase [Bifidobacterium tibiigranuli]
MGQEQPIECAGDDAGRPVATIAGLTPKGRHRRIATVVASSLITVLLTAGYVIADIVDVAPGLLTVNTAVLQGQPGPRAAIPAGAVAAAKAERDVPINADKANALLDRFAEAEGVGSQYSIAIADQRGSVIAQRNDGTPREPASTLKTLTALAAASSLDMGSTFSTESYLNQPAGGPDTITLKGNGDMLLGRGASDPKHVNGRAGLETLAQQTARGLRQRGIATVALAYDDTLFGAIRAPKDIAQNNPGNIYYAPISSMAVDGGRAWPSGSAPNPDTFDGYPPMSTQPAADTAGLFATLLKRQGIAVKGATSAASAPAGLSPLASVHSAALSEVMAFMMRHSDNTLAEEFGRLTALKAGRENSPQGAVSAVQEKLKGMGIDLSGLTMADVCGLSPGSQVTASTLAAVQARNLTATGAAAAGEGLSIPGLVGTASDRLDNMNAAGLLRVKTGSLDTVTAMVGNASRSSGGTLAFAVIVNNPDDMAAAKLAVDTFISELTGL